MGMPVSMNLIGNALSVYWQARALAWIAGASFSALGGRATGSFVEFLPRTARAAETSNATELRRACSACDQEKHWRWPHLCLGAWTSIQGIIRVGMRWAFRASGVEAAVREELRRHDVAIHL